MEKFDNMLKFEELDSAEELGDGWVAIGAVCGLGVVGVAVYLGVAT